MNGPQMIEEADRMSLVEAKDVLKISHGMQLTGFQRQYPKIPWFRNPMGKIFVSKRAVLAAVNGNGTQAAAFVSTPTARPSGSDIWVQWDGGPIFRTNMLQYTQGKCEEFSALWNGYMRSENWRRKKEAKIQEQGGRCGILGCKFDPTECHHLTYDRRFNELPADLLALCAFHHGLIHPNEQKRDIVEQLQRLMIDVSGGIQELLALWRPTK